MPNILLTNLCNQKCPYCFVENELKKKKIEMSFKKFKLVLDFLERSNEKIIRLMGGEPTLHSKFENIINYIFSRGFKAHIFTNGLFSSKIRNFLVKKEKNIKYSLNINSPNMYSVRSWKLITKNLKALTLFRNCLIGSVIWQENLNIDYLLDLANKYSVKVIMLRIANPIINRKNEYIPYSRYSALAKNVIREIEKASKNEIKIGFGCGFSKKMFTEKQFKILKKYNVVNLNWGCDGNSGRFDIGTDLSVFRCFPLSNWQKKKLSDFDNIKEIENYFNKLMQKYQTKNSDTDFIHQGPCFSYLLNKST